MKLFRYILIMAAIAGTLSCDDNEGSGAGDATVGFEQATYAYRESEGTVRIPVKFTGEAKKYPIVFDIEPSVDPEKGMTDNEPVVVDQVAHFIQLDNFRYVGNPDGPVFIEVKLKDDDLVNASRYLALTIASASGAEIVNGTTTIEIRDNDDSSYDKLQGRWLFRSYDFDTGSPSPSFIVYILDGMTEEEAETNRAANKLMCYGFGGYSESPGGVPFTWYLDYHYNESTGTGSLSVDMTKALINANEDVFGVGVNPTMVVFSTMPYDTKTQELSMETTIYANWSTDVRTITFDPDMVLVPLLFSNGQYTNKTMGELSRITMIRQE